VPDAMSRYFSASVESWWMIGVGWWVIISNDAKKMAADFVFPSEILIFAAVFKLLTIK
jgi:hypothetical protein